MGSKEAIINWMITNMNPTDILSCLQQYSQESQGSQESSSNQNINELTKQMSKVEVAEMIKEISVEDIISQLNEITDLEQRYSRLIDICYDSGVINDPSIYDVRKSKKYGIQLLKDEDILNPFEIEKMINDCATREALRLTNKLKK